jgi:hypothetical protein
MYWGAGPELGLLSFLGSVLFVMSAAIVWRGRDDVFIWVHDEFTAFRRNLSRHTPVGPFYGPREESLFRIIPNQFFHSFRRMPHRRTSRGEILLLVGLLIGPLLLLLDFFI